MMATGEAEAASEAVAGCPGTAGATVWVLDGPLPPSLKINHPAAAPRNTIARISTIRNRLRKSGILPGLQGKAVDQVASQEQQCLCGVNERRLFCGEV